MSVCVAARVLEADNVWFLAAEVQGDGANAEVDPDVPAGAHVKDVTDGEHLLDIDFDDGKMTASTAGSIY